MKVKIGRSTYRELSAVLGLGDGGLGATPVLQVLGPQGIAEQVHKLHTRGVIHLGEGERRSQVEEEKGERRGGSRVGASTCSDSCTDCWKVSR